MKLLIVAMPDSVHVARWLRQVEGLGWDVEVFSSHPCGFSHPALRNVDVHTFFRSSHPGGVRQHGIPVLQRDLAFVAERALARVAPNHRRNALARLIRRRRPDVVHSIEMQHAGYLTLAVRDMLRGEFPPWVVTNWGNDIYHFGKEALHAALIRRVLAGCDAYTCECERDVQLGREMGFRGVAFRPYPNAGGFDLAHVRSLRSGAPSTRRTVMLKGYQNWAGRALVALRAIESCADVVRRFRLCVYSAVPEVATAALEVAKRTAMDVEVIRFDANVSHDEMLRRHGEARTSLGVSVTDGVSTSFLEALVMGSFPIQTWTSCANEWIEDGETGILVGPDDQGEIAAALRRVLTDDSLVDRAADLNWRVATSRLDERILREQTIEMYREVAGLRSRSGHGPGSSAGPTA